MARVLFLATNRERTPFPVMPVGPAIVAAHTARAGHEARVLDLMFEESPEAAIERVVAEFRPEVVGASLRNIDNSDLIETKYYLPEIERLLEALRATAPGVPVILGGAATSIEPEALLRLWGPSGRNLVDALLTGDAERRFPELVSRLVAGESTASMSLPGLARISAEGAFEHQRVGLAEPIDGLFDAALFGHTDVARYDRHDGVYPIQTRRGCAFTCTYCTYGSLEGLRTRYRTPEEVALEIERAVARGVVRFEFVDAVFSHPAAHARAVLHEIVRRGLSKRVELSAAGLNPVGVTEELIALMRKAGFTSVSATVEGASTAMLERLQKGFDRDGVARLAAWLPKHGIRTVWIFLIGSPGETRGTVEETFAFIHEHISTKDLVYITNGVRVYRGTGLHRRLVEEGKLAPDANLLEPVFAFSETLPRDWYLARLLAFSRAHPNVVNSFEAGQPIVERLARALGRLPLPRPRWRLLPAIRRLGSPFRAARADALSSSPWPVVVAG
ncbi:MAG: radical SAM protein [Acidobacteria bacterium]|nr:radical SAM protein [Acidobacteriota bacterium]